MAKSLKVKNSQFMGLASVTTDSNWLGPNLLSSCVEFKLIA